MSSSDLIQVDGKVIEVLPSNKFFVESTDEVKTKILAHLSGKMRQNKIRIVLGDLVYVQVSPYDLTKGRIVRRKDR